MFNKKIKERLSAINLDINDKLEKINVDYDMRVLKLECRLFEHEHPNGLLSAGIDWRGRCLQMFEYVSGWNIKSVRVPCAECDRGYSTKINDRYYLKIVKSSGETIFYLIEDETSIELDMIDDESVNWENHPDAKSE